MNKGPFEYWRDNWLLILFLLALQPLNSLAQQDSECENVLEKAVEMFDVKNYRGVVDRFIDCSVEIAAGTQKKRADGILAISTNSVFADKDYDRVIKILSKYPVTEFEIEKDRKIALYEALGESYLKKQGSHSEAANKTILELARLTLDDQYMPHEQKLSKQFMENFTAAKQGLRAGSQPEASKHNTLKWILIGGGAVAAGVTTAVLLSGGGAQQLPLPPGSPNSN